MSDITFLTSHKTKSNVFYRTKFFKYYLSCIWVDYIETQRINLANKVCEIIKKAVVLLQ